jgi:hypothetical protein
VLLLFTRARLTWVVLLALACWRWPWLPAGLRWPARPFPSHCPPTRSRRPGGRRFVDNASFGAYASVVQSPAYRDDKARTTLDLLPGLLAGHQGPRLVARAGDLAIQGPQAVLVSNNVYGMGDIAHGDRRRDHHPPGATARPRALAGRGAEPLGEPWALGLGSWHQFMLRLASRARLTRSR